MNQDILFSIPDFYKNFALNLNLIELMEGHPEYFYSNVKVDSCYGSFPGAIWNGGRATIGQATFSNIVATLSPFLKKGISIRYTFTNPLITGKHLYDYYCNRILEISESCAAADSITAEIGVTINTDLMKNHIEKSFPSFYTVWSTTKSIKSIDELNELSKDNITVAYYGMNNTEAIEKFEHPENVEMLVCEACIPSCPNRSDHYAEIAKLQMVDPSSNFKCPHNCELYMYYDTVVKRPHYISYDDIVNTYLPLGINKFKISGRNDHVVNIIENYVNYFCLPEHRDRVRNMLLLGQLS